MVRTIGARDKIRRKFIHSFARQYLADHNVQMNCGETQILKPIPNNERLYNILLPNTRYYAGEIFVEQGIVRKITSFEELKSLGFVIISTPVNETTRWMHQQKVKYELKRVGETGEHLGKIPKSHYIEFDMNNKIVGLYGPNAGPMGFGGWVTLTDQRYVREGAGRKLDLRNLSKNSEEILRQQMNKWRGVEEMPQPIYIKEAAFMITESNEIVCFPNTPDMPSIMISGMKGSGKCIVQDSMFDYIVDANGKWMKIEDQPEKVMTLNKDLKLEVSKVKNYHKREVNDVIKFTTRNNRTITVTPEHPLLTVRGWVQAKDLKVKDHIAAARTFPIESDKKIRQCEVVLLAYLLASGGFDRKEPHLTFRKFRDDYDMLTDFNFYLRRFDKNLKKVRARIVATKGENTLITYLKFLGLWGLNDTETFIPNRIMTLNNKQIRLFLSRYYSAQGYTRKHYYQVVYTSKSPKMIAQLKHLFLRLNIVTTSGTHRLRAKNRKTYYELTINNKENITRFSNTIVPLNKYKRVVYKRIYKDIIADQFYRGPGSHGNHDMIPGDIWKLDKPKDWLPAHKKLGYQFKSRDLENPRFPVTRETLQKIVEGTGRPILKKFAESDIIWLQVTKIEHKSGKFTAWDMEIDHPEHNFVVNDIIVHNSYSLHSIVSRFFWKPEYDYNICILNDSSRETGTWCLPNSDNSQIKMLKRLNERPLPLPCVYLHPLVKDEYEKMYMGNVGFNVTIPFKEIIRNHKQYLNLKDSARYFTKFISELLDCRTEKQARNIIESLATVGVPPQTSNKIQAEFETLFDSKMTDISTKGQNSWFTSKNPEVLYNPLTACIHAGLLPVLETEFVSNYRDMLSIYFTYFVGDLFMRQKQDPAFLEDQSELLLVVDEAHNISQKSIKSGADMLLRRCVREGRPRRIGTLLATQKFTELPAVIKDNSTYLICFKNPGEANELVKQYNMGKQTVNLIRDLEKHQCLAYTTEHFIVYDSNGKRRKSNINEVFIGKTLPPYSLHKRPTVKGG